MPNSDDMMRTYDLNAAREAFNNSKSRTYNVEITCTKQELEDLKNTFSNNRIIKHLIEAIEGEMKQREQQ